MKNKNISRGREEVEAKGRSENAETLKREDEKRKKSSTGGDE